MSKITSRGLARLLRSPQCCSEFSNGEWDVAIRQARSANVLSRLAIVLEHAGQMPSVPARVRSQLISGLAMAKQQRISALFEIEAIRSAVVRSGTPIILLKGGAYVARGLNAAQGRRFADIDILVPKERLADVEAALMLRGWNTTHHDEYDQRYYRQWMHEIPPLRHMTRGTVIDVHHTILPPTAGRRLDASKLIASARSIPGQNTIKTLAPVDMVLHSMTHLFYDGELERGFRDLVDLDSLLSQYGREIPGFWDQLIPRARELDLARPLHYGLRFVGEVLGTPVPQAVLKESAQDGPNFVLRGTMDALFIRALGPAHASSSDALTPLARFLLYLRSHWLRMPPHLLVFHLLRKMLVSPPEVIESEGEGNR